MNMICCSCRSFIRERHLAYRRCAVAEAGEGTLELDLLPIPGLKFIIR